MIKIIAAADSNLGIGYKGRLPWPHHKEDMKFFKTQTAGDALLMGRKTFESLPKVLPHRHHYVLTSDASKLPEHPQVSRVYPQYGELESLIQEYKGTSHNALWVIGGAVVYDLMLTQSDTLWLTRFRNLYTADTHFPIAYSTLYEKKQVWDFPTKHYFRELWTRIPV